MKLRRILCPIDFSGPSRTALAHAVSFAEATQAEVVALHVVEPLIYPIEYGMAPVSPRDLEAAASENARERLQELVQEVVQGRVKATAQVVFGRAEDAICEQAKRSGADLIVLATHGLTGLKHLLLGSVAERVVRMAECPVLTVKQGQHLEPAG